LHASAVSARAGFAKKVFVEKRDVDRNSSASQHCEDEVRSREIGCRWPPNMQRVGADGDALVKAGAQQLVGQSRQGCEVNPEGIT
jgi:hypothetical protein